MMPIMLLRKSVIPCDLAQVPVPNRSWSPSTQLIHGGVVIPNLTRLVE